MLCRRTPFLRELSDGCKGLEMRFWRFLGNRRVTEEKLIAGWGEQTRQAVGGRHVLAIQDTSEIKFSTTQENRRGLGKVGKGNAFGLLLHAMLAVDADSGACLGLVGGKIWTRKGDVDIAHSKRPLAQKESGRWIETADQAKDVLAAARVITVIDDREGDFYAHWARTPEANVHHLSRVMHDHALIKGGTLRQAVKRIAYCATAVIKLPKRVDHKPRQAHLSMRFGSVVLKRPTHTGEKNLPESVALNFVEVIELRPPKGAKPVHWLLLTTHDVTNADQAWQIVTWYKQRWIIEQLFRSMKSQGLRIEDAQLQSAERLSKFVAIAAKAATIVIQLVQARTGGEELPAHFAFSEEEIGALAAISSKYSSKTKLQSNPHNSRTLAWAAWIVARLGGWNGYASQKPPGPITIHNGLNYFQSFFAGWSFKNV
jgi:Transposase DDE domain